MIEAADTDLGAGALLAADVDRRRGVVADEDRRQPGDPSALLHERRHIDRHLCANSRRHGGPVDHPCAHRGGQGIRPTPPLGAQRRVSGAYSAISLRSVPSPAKRTTTTPPGSTPVTTPSPKLAWTTSSPVCSSSAGRGSTGAPAAAVASQREAAPDAAPWRSVSSSGSSSTKREGRLRSARPNN